MEGLLNTKMSGAGGEACDDGQDQAPLTGMLGGMTERSIYSNREP
jgi:hypothetical protein